jgi:hypothetical protein
LKCELQALTLWNFAQQTLSRRTPILAQERLIIRTVETTTGDPSSLQYIGLRIERMLFSGLKMINPTG